jgi:hypothetical protein
MRLFVFLPRAADWLPGTCLACKCPLDEHRCEISSVTRPNRAERRRLGVELVVEVECNGTPVGPVNPCPVCAQGGRHALP